MAQVVRASLPGLRRDERTGFKPRSDLELFISTKSGITNLFRKKSVVLIKYQFLVIFYRCNFYFLIHINNTKHKFYRLQKLFPRSS